MKHGWSIYRLAALSLALLAGLGGCAQVIMIAPPTPEVRAELGVVGVVPKPFDRATGLETPVKGAGEGALSGMRQGGLGSVRIGLEGAGVVGILLAPVAAVVGSVVGALRAHPEDIVRVVANTNRVIQLVTQRFICIPVCLHFKFQAY